MKALRFENNELRLGEIATPERGDEAIVRVTMSGICNTDIEIVRGYAGFQGTIGHEFVGVVESAPDSPELAGKRVVGEINVGCGECALCLAGDPRHCPERTVLGIKRRDGAHAEFLTLPVRNLLVVPDAVTDEQAVFTEPLGAAYGITEQVPIEADTKAAVIGDGKLGLLCALALRLKTNSVTLIGRHKEKMAVAEKHDIESLIDGDLKGLAGRFDVVVEASGSESGFASALDLVRPRGKIVLKSTFHGRPQWEAWRVVVDEITVVGSRCGRFEPALCLLADQSIDVLPLISDEFRLADGVDAMRAAQVKGSLKILLSMK